ncbi:hypothetical protein CfE428DRAFT_4186 [Chthoniobacter flavus Ellin428]|uniref:Uncharacterized protein n=1 Tax=Chthoniobacter flavus Ellin428 TaxID=497964 RepID=B4D5J7_9BACT|nr:hypothetical protein CfE428DRAFT_4186 [Chthoniobacter flavus Ellin428]
MSVGPNSHSVFRDARPRVSRTIARWVDFVSWKSALGRGLTNGQPSLGTEIFA